MMKGESWVGEKEDGCRTRMKWRRGNVGWFRGLPHHHLHVHTTTFPCPRSEVRMERAEDRKGMRPVVRNQQRTWKLVPTMRGLYVLCYTVWTNMQIWSWQNSQSRYFLTASIGEIDGYIRLTSQSSAFTKHLATPAHLSYFNLANPYTCVFVGWHRP